MVRKTNEAIPLKAPGEAPDARVVEFEREVRLLHEQALEMLSRATKAVRELTAKVDRLQVAIDEVQASIQALTKPGSRR